MGSVEIFRTNVANIEEASKVIDELSKLLPETKVNFDLEDCDNILRIESFHPIDINGIATHLEMIGCKAEILT